MKPESVSYATDSFNHVAVHPERKYICDSKEYLHMHDLTFRCVPVFIRCRFKSSSSLVQVYVTSSTSANHHLADSLCCHESLNNGSGQNYYTETGLTKLQNRWWCLLAPPLLNVKKWRLYCIATPLSSSK